MAAGTEGLSGLVAAATPFVFFTGKGGVGKTSTACATAIALAEGPPNEGAPGGGARRVLLVSTDPASNLDEVLGIRAGRVPVAVPDVPGLDAMDIDPDTAAAQYREKVLGPYRDVLPASAVAGIEEQLSGACTVEIAAFNEFVALLTDPAITERYDHVVFDTAPTGHTLRLLSLPAAWSQFLVTNPGGASCIGPLAELGAQQQRYADAMGVLTDAARTTVVLVTRPEPGALTEAARAAAELRELGLAHQRLVVNGVFTASALDDPVAVAWQCRGDDALADAPAELAALTAVDRVPLLAGLPVGVAGLRAMLHPLTPAPPPIPASPTAVELGIAGLVDDLAAGGRGLVMTMGKGGVGKTTVACAVAVALARRGHPVTLTTTDPAAHVDAVTGAGLDGLDGLEVTRLDPVAETAAYTETVLAEAGAGLDEQGRALLAEDLRSPCTEEIAVFHAFARTVAAATDRFVVVDTAPTGHTLLLLDASRSYSRQVAAQTGHVPAAPRDLAAHLTDPDYTRVLLVTVAEATPVHEAAALQTDLARAGIKPYAWVVNQSLAAAAPTDPLLVARAASEARYLTEVTARHADRTAVLAWSPVPPVGVEALTRLAGPAADAHRP